MSVSTLTGASPTRSGGSGGTPLRINNVTKVFGRGPERTVALEDVSLTVERGEFLTVVGASGCGKSTLMEIVGGLIEASAGEITIAGTPVDGTDPAVGIVFQQESAFPWRSVAENVEFGLEMTGVGAGERHERAQAMMIHVSATGVTPLAVPLMVVIGRESLPAGTADDALLIEAEALAAEAMRLD